MRIELVIISNRRFLWKINTSKIPYVTGRDKGGEMKLFICGSRTITDKEWIFTEIEKCIEENVFTDITILEGEAKGADLIAKEWAISHNIPVCHVIMLQQVSQEINLKQKSGITNTRLKGLQFRTLIILWGLMKVKILILPMSLNFLSLTASLKFISFLCSVTMILTLT